MLKTIWNQPQTDYPCAQGDIVRDVVIIGGGIAGYLTAFKLAEAGECVTLLEADKLFSGTTCKTTAKITFNQGNIYHDLYRRYGRAATVLYYNAQISAMREYEKLIEKYSINCDFCKTGSYIYSRTSRKKLEKTCRILRDLDADCEITNRTQPENSVCALFAGEQYIFDPLKFLCALPVRFEIFENTRAVNIDAKGLVIHTEKARVFAKKIIIATHFPIINNYGAYFIKLRQSTSYTAAFSNADIDAMYLDERDDGLSLRPYAGGVLIGGGDHRTGRIKDWQAFKRLKAKAEEIFDGPVPVSEWNAQDVMTFDGVPMAGVYSKKVKNLYVITGFNKWGMTNAMTAAGVIRDIILNRDNPYTDLFSPQRKIKKSFGAFIKNAAVNAAGITLGYLRATTKTAADLARGEGDVVWYKGKRRAVYRDNDDKLYAIGRMCTHMHCELKWNANTRTWDCPCHGSRFDIHGNIISEPAVKSCKTDCGADS